VTPKYRPGLGPEILQGGSDQCEPRTRSGTNAQKRKGALQNNIFEKVEAFAGQPRYQRVKNALPLIGFGKTRLYELIKQGRIRAVKLDGATYVDLASVTSLFERCPEIVPLRHQLILTEADLGFPAPDPLLPAVTISEADCRRTSPLHLISPMKNRSQQGGCIATIDPRQTWLVQPWQARGDEPR
jgi:hypothetical protein